MSFLALALIGAGSSYGRATDKQVAIDICAKQVLADWSGFYDVAGKELSVNVFDIGDISEVQFSDRGVCHYPEDDKKPVWIDRLELAKVIVPSKKRR